MKKSEFDDIATPKWIKEQLAKARSEKDRWAIDCVASDCAGNLVSKKMFLEDVQRMLKEHGNV